MAFILAGSAALAASATVAVAVTVSALSGAFSGPKSPDAQKQNFRQAVGPRRRAYGEVKVGGIYCFLDDRASYLYQIFMLNSGEIDSFVSHWLGDEQATVDGSGNVTSPTNYVDDGPTYLVTLDTVLGTDDQAAFPRLVSAFPGEWTSAHQLKGIACTLMTLLSPPAKYFSAHFPAGIPDYNAVIRASKVWDPRL